MTTTAMNIEERVTASPYRTLAIAVGVGYVLGGGLFSPLSGRLIKTGIRVGFRIVALPLLTRQLRSLLTNGARGDE